MPVFLHTFHRENTYAKLHEDAPFEMKNYKRISREGALTPPYRRGGYPLPGPHLPRRLGIRPAVRGAASPRQEG